MHNSADLLNAVKKAAIDAVEASKPMDFCFGKVISTAPLKVSVEQKLTLGSAQLILTRNVTDYKVNITANFDTEEAIDHSHKVSGVKSITIHNGLKVGEEVILLKKKGGQKYLIIDKVVNP